ncbi:MAG: ATP-binding protein [Solirubrobacteraceae bacterium]
MTGGFEGLEEREVEVAILDRLLADAVAGRGALAYVEGPPGIGKTRLMGMLRDRATAAGATVLAARAGEGESQFAYGVVRQLIERTVLDLDEAGQSAVLRGAAALAAPLLGLAPEVRGPVPDAPDPALAAFHGLYWLTSNLAAEAPLVVVVDDAHWADAPSLRFLHYLARRLEGMPVLLAVASRPEDMSAEPELLAGLAAEPDAQIVRPGALSAAAVGRLVSRSLGAEPEPAFVDSCLAASGGVPFYLVELLRALQDEKVAPVAGEASRVASLGPPTVTRSVLLRVAGMPTTAAALVPAIAVLGTEVTLSRAAALAGLSTEEAAGGADALAAADLLTADGLAFTHPIIAAAVTGELGPGERARLHAAAAALLRDEGADPARIAPHLLASEPSGQSWVVDVLRDAASGASARGAPEIAARELRRALREPPTDDVRDALLGELGAAELRAGDPAAVARLRVAAASGPSTARVQGAQLLGRALAAAGDAEGAVAVLGGLADELRDEDPEAALLLDGDLAAIGLLDPRMATEARRRLERHAGVTGATHPERMVVVSLAQQAWVGAESVEKTRVLAQRALSGGLLLEHETSDSLAFNQAVYALIVADGLDEAAAHLAAARADAERRGSLYGYAATSTIAALGHLRSGDVLAAEAQARAAVEAGEHAVLTPLARAFLGIALLERGQLEEAEACVAPPALPEDPPPSMASNHVVNLRGICQLLRGDHAEAAATLRDVGMREATFGIVNPILAWRLGLAGALARGGDLDGARAMVDEQAALAERWGSPAIIAPVRRAQAMWLGGDEQLAALREAVTIARAGVGRLDLVRALIDLGAALRRANERVAAREPLVEALEIARPLGARQLVERAHRELQVAGAKPRRLQFSGLEALTAAERRVAELAAEGGTNREIAQSLFVTAKTVENHLGRAYRKLGVSSREDLGALLEQAAGAPAPTT